MTDNSLTYLLPQFVKDLKNLLNCNDMNIFITTLLTLVLNLMAEISFQIYLDTCPEPIVRNGYRERSWRFAMFEVRVRIPCVRHGYFKPAFEDRLTKYEKHILNQLITKLYTYGLSTRNISNVLKESDFKSLEKSQISNRIADCLQEIADDYRPGKICQYYPVVFTDALHQNIRFESVVVDMTIIIVIGIRADGLKMDVLDIYPVLSESGNTYSKIFNNLKDIGLKSPALIISDSHPGIKKAVRNCFPGACWQRCAVHLCRDVFRKLPKKTGQKERLAFMNSVSAVFFKSESREDALERAEKIIQTNSVLYPEAVEVFKEGYEDALTFFSFEKIDRKVITSSNYIEGLNRRIRQRTKTVVVFPGIEAYLRLVFSFVDEKIEPTLTREYFTGNSLIEATAEHLKELEELPQEVSEQLASIQTVSLSPEVQTEASPASVCLELARNDSVSREGGMVQSGSRGLFCKVGGRKVVVTSQLAVHIDQTGRAYIPLAGLKAEDSPDFYCCLSKILAEKNISLFCTDALNETEHSLLEKLFPDTIIQNDVNSVLDYCLSFIPKDERKTAKKEIKHVLSHSFNLIRFNQQIGKFFEENQLKFPTACRDFLFWGDRLTGCFDLGGTVKPVGKMMTVSMVNDTFDLMEQKLDKGQTPTIEELARALIEACDEMSTAWNDPKNNRAINPIHFSNPIHSKKENRGVCVLEPKRLQVDHKD